MGLRPPCVRPRAASQKVEEPTSVERAVRPLPERTGPLRSADGLFRPSEPSASRAPAPNVGAPVAQREVSPIGDAVAKAYQVFDRYLEEGKAYGAGQSAWYDGKSFLPAALPQGGKLPADDLTGAALWLIKQLRDSPQAPAPAAAAIQSMLGQTTAPTAQPNDWPRPKWPDRATERGPDKRPGNTRTTRWVPEEFPPPGDPPRRTPPSVGGGPKDDGADAPLPTTPTVPRVGPPAVPLSFAGLSSLANAFLPDEP